MSTAPFPWKIETPTQQRYFLEGVPFTREQRDAIVSNNISFHEIMSLRNIEQRRAAVQYVGLNSLLARGYFTLVDVSHRGNRLYVSQVPYLATDDRPEWLFFLAYDCPSTLRPYVSAVDSKEILDRFDTRTYLLVRAALIGLAHHATARIPKLRGILADSAMAWKLSLSLDEYRSMTAEA